MVVAASNWWGSLSGVGIWSGIFIIIAGSLTMGAGEYANSVYLRVGAMVMCIFALIFATASGILNLVAFRYLYFSFFVFVNKKCSATFFTMCINLSLMSVFKK